MTMILAELQDAASQAFGGAGLAGDADASWALIADMGWLSMTVAEENGGLGLGGEAIGALHFQLGRSLVRGPAIAQMMVVAALDAAAPSPERDDLLARAVAGERMTAPLAIGGHPGCVPDADRASHLLLASPDRVALAPIEEFRLTPWESWDKTRRLFDAEPRGEGVGLILGAHGEAAGLLSRIDALRSSALAADSLGGGAAILDLTIEFLKTRQQFGRPLGLFQALKHRIADLKIALATAEALFWTVVSNPDASPDDLGAVKALASITYRTIAEDAVQLHGGIGLTMEHHCHLFLKRATLNEALGGDADYWNERSGRRALTRTA